MCDDEGGEKVVDEEEEEEELEEGWVYVRVKKRPYVDTN